MLSKGYGARVFSCAKMRRGNAGAALRRPRSFSLHQPSTDHVPQRPRYHPDRKSTRLNSSHSQISYADFCLKQKRYVYAPVSVADWTLSAILSAADGHLAGLRGGLWDFDMPLRPVVIAQVTRLHRHRVS